MLKIFKSVRNLLPLFIFSLLFSLGIYAQPDSSALPSLSTIVQENSYPVIVKDGQLLGIGGEKLIKESREADIFMFGENHGVSEIAEIATILYNELSKESPRLLVTEIGPTTATEVEELVRAGSFKKFMDKGVNLLSVPFFFLEQEVPLLNAAIDNFPLKKNCVWGLDQEFIAGAPIVLQRLGKLATTNAEKKVVSKAHRKDFLNPFMVGMGNGKILSELQKVFSSSTNQEAIRITNGLVKSYEIYQANSDGRGRWSNETRETFMMQNFEQYASEYPDSIPPLFFKFGSYHLHKGSSPTVKRALGLRINEWAEKKNLKALNVAFDALDGQTINPILGTKTDLTTIKNWNNTIFKKSLKNNQPTLFDLRAVKGHPETKGMSSKVLHMINGYDYLILLPNATASDFLPGTYVTYAYGIPILLCVLLILGLVIYGIFKLVKRFLERRKIKNT